MRLTSLQSITDFMNCAGRTLPDNIRLWARRNLAVARSHEVSPEERRHAQRALSIMMNIQWKSNYFESIDPDEARRILDEELYGLTGNVVKTAAESGTTATMNVTDVPEGMYILVVDNGKNKTVRKMHITH